jgi:hypothetical protein
VDDARSHRRAVFGTEPALREPTRAIRLDEHVRVAQEPVQCLGVRGFVEVELCRALAARRLYVEQGEGRQMWGCHEEDVRAVRWLSAIPRHGQSEAVQ